MKETCNIQVIGMMMVVMMISTINTKVMMTINFTVTITILFLNTDNAGKLVANVVMNNIIMCICP